MNSFRRVVAFVAAIVVSGCAHQQINATNDVRIAATPKGAPQRTITNFSNSLRCMDGLFEKYNISNLVVGAQDIPDSTEIVVAGTKDMLITALSNMSIKSGAVRFVALGQDLQDITRFHQLHPRKNFKAPDFFIRGAITQVDQGVLETQARAGAAVARDFSLEASANKIASIVSLDMNMGLVSTLQMLPSATSSNSIAVIRSGVGTGLTGTIEKLGLLFQVDFTKSEGLHHATRTLVELGAIELLGKLAQVPYWECLDIRTTNPLVQKQILQWFGALEREEVVTFVQAKLKTLGLYAGALNGFDDAETREAIARYKAAHGLIANGEPDYLLYYQLMADPTPVHPAYMPALSKTVQIAAGDRGREEYTREKTVVQPTALEMSSLSTSEISLTTDRGDKPVYRSGESVTLKVQTSRGAYVYCYYQPEAGQIVKIFPNRFVQRRENPAGETLRIPSSNDFSVRFDRRGVFEKVMCMAAQTDIERSLPFELRDKDLQPVSLERLTTLYRRPVRSVEDIYRIYKDSASVVPIKDTLVVEVQ
ncbi:MAG: DUF4384 domain-containing protein [Gammaproteobacteria bacterium]